MSKKRAEARAAKRARARADRERRRDPARALVSAMMLFFFSASKRTAPRLPVKIQTMPS